MRRAAATKRNATVHALVPSTTGSEVDLARRAADRLRATARDLGPLNEALGRVPDSKAARAVSTLLLHADHVIFELDAFCAIAGGDPDAIYSTGGPGFERTLSARLEATVAELSAVMERRSRA